MITNEHHVGFLLNKDDSILNSASQTNEHRQINLGQERIGHHGLQNYFSTGCIIWIYLQFKTSL